MAGPGLDVRVALVGLVVVNALAMSGGPFRVVLAAGVLVLVGLATVGRPTVLAGGALCLGLFATSFVAVPRGGGLGWGVLATTGFWCTRFTVAILAAAYVVLTVSVSDCVALLARWRAPRQLAIPLTVMLRFLPQARTEVEAIREAMALRGIPVGPAAWVAHPLRTVEYLVVPLLVSCSRIADDLTASGLTRGIGGPTRPTPLRTLRLRARDLVAVVALAGLLVIAFVGHGEMP